MGWLFFKTYSKQIIEMNVNKKKKIILVCSDGGHLAQILELKDLFLKYDYLIATEESRASLPLKKKYYIKYLKARSKGKKRSMSFVYGVFANFFISFSIILKHYPKVIVTTGSHTAIPMCILGKLLGVKIVYILSFARVDSRASSADLIYRFADKFIVQWPDVQKHYKKSIYLGGIY